MADKSIFSGEKGRDEQEASEEVKKSFAGKNLQKFGNSLKDLGSDTITSLKDEATGTFKSFTDAILPKAFRDKDFNDTDGFITKEVSIANRHRNEISNILSDVSQGNLFDAGVSSLNLLNFGTKWTIKEDLYTDKDSYPFRYWYHYSDIPDLSVLNQTDRVNSETESQRGFIKLLESIEDPTILGFSVKINYKDSPLFKLRDSVVTTSDTESIDRVNTEGNKDGNSPAVSASAPPPAKPNSALDFIERYKVQHRELHMCEEYLEEFSESIKKIFEAPETTVKGGESNYNNLNKSPLKNHYIHEIKGLDKLDNPFVDYGKGDKESHEMLELTLNEDIRMFTNRLAFLYRNLTWSYNMGKKLIPENKLRFDLYIKISDMRSYTSKFNEDIARDKYSRVVYELKDCEFFFDESLNPDTLKIGGFGSITDDYASLPIKIKYRKVNRIFYSRMFGNSGNVGDMYIGDKFYEPGNYTDVYGAELDSWGFSPKSTLKREAKSNNIPVKVSLDERLNRLKTQGLFRGEDNNDTALNRFVKGIGNEAVKSGASIVDEGLQKVKTNLNNQKDKVDSLFNNNFAGSMRDFLDGNVGKKTTDLGDLHPDTGSVKGNHSVGHVDINEPSSANKHPDGNVNIINPNADLHPTISEGILSPSADLHPTLDEGILSPSADLHPTLDEGIVLPDEDLHPTLNQGIILPNEDLHPTLDEGIIMPEEDLHPTLDQGIILPNEDLHPTLDQGIILPDEDLHPTLDEGIIIPDGDLHPNVDKSVVSPDKDLHPDVSKVIDTPNTDLHPNIDKNIDEPNNNVHPNNNSSISIENVNVNGVVEDNSISSPNKNVNGDVKKSIDNPNENLSDSFTKFVRKDPSENGKLDDC